ncbi:MAG: response regulator, partial [Myxococcota bacterium]|nr:response regulator [Myxococcota bacterium]
MDQKILCVDDSRHIRQLVTRLLKSEFEVFEAKDGEEALGFLEGFIFDVIVTDLNMPNMDGLTFLSKMRQLSIKTPTLVFSGESNPKVIRESLRLGADDFIAKPCDLELLKQKIIFVAKQKCIEIQEGHGELEIRDPPNKPMLLDENATVMAESSGIAPAPALVGAPKQVLPEEGSEKSQKKKTAVQISDPFGFF